MPHLEGEGGEGGEEGKRRQNCLGMQNVSFLSGVTN